MKTTGTPGTGISRTILNARTHTQQQQFLVLDKDKEMPGSPVPPVPPATVSLESSCPRCGRAMFLPLPPDCDRADAERLARLILCDRCTSGHYCALEPPEPPAVRWPQQAQPRLPYADD